MTTTAYPDRFVRDGDVTRTPNRPHGLHEAIRTAPAGEEIHVRGTVNGIELAGPPGKSNSVHRDSPIDVKLTGLGGKDEGAIMRSAFMNDEGGGIDRLAIRDMNIAAWPTQYPFASVQNPRPGKIVFRRCWMHGGGGKVKSFVRTYCHEVVGTQLRAEGALEYLWYWTGSKATIKDVAGRDLKRGIVQGAVRNTEGTHQNVKMTNLKLSPDDVCEISGVVAEDCGQHGSSAISITGHPGTVRISGLDITSPWGTGAVYCRWNSKQNQQEPGHWKTARAIDFGKVNSDLRAQNELVLDMRGSRVELPSTDRVPFFIDSTTSLTVASDSETVVASPRPVMHLEMNGNGMVICPAGFPKAGQPVADKSILNVAMSGTYEGWERTGWNSNQPFLRKNQPFDPSEFYSARG